MKTQKFSWHLSELRNRLLSWLLIFALGSFIGYQLNSEIFAILIAPLNQPVFYTSPAGGFDFVFKISLFFGFLISLPFLVYQVFRFIEPALPKKFPRLFITVLLVSSMLLILGMGFAYFISLPAALYFLNKFTTENVKALISANEYFTFITRYILGFGLVFQMPLIILGINSVQKISLKTLFNLERWVIVICVVIAAIITPTPDIFNLFVMAVPLILLYQLTILMVWFINKRNG